MGNRLSKIYTRTGDDGTTGLGDGSRTAKDAPLIQAIGSADELNSLIGIVRSQLSDTDELQELFSCVQHDLFDIGGILCMPAAAMAVLSEKRIDWLEKQLDQHNEALPALKNFILPGGSPAASFCHLARTVCRRTERQLVTLNRTDSLQPTLLRYLNRLSDLLFVLCRVLARRDGHSEVLWQQQR